MKKIVCVFCGAENDDDAKLCKHCYAELTHEEQDERLTVQKPKGQRREIRSERYGT